MNNLEPESGFVWTACLPVIPSAQWGLCRGVRGHFPMSPTADVLILSIQYIVLLYLAPGFVLHVLMRSLYSHLNLSPHSQN